jgi:hypothetical protein
MNRLKLIYDGETLLETIEREIDWVTIRKVRDYELKKTDWRAVKDRTMSQAWKDYRQFLRDLPQNFFDESDEPSQGANAAADAWELFEKPEGE